MRLSRTSLHGPRGWSAVVGLSTVLTVLVAGQLPATADAPEIPAAAPVASADDRRPASATAVRPATVEPAVATPVRTVGKPAAARPVVKAAVARPAASALCEGSGWQQRRGQAALASLKGGAARTGFRVEFTGARKGYLGLTHLQERRIQMFVRACGTQTDTLLRHVMAHELGHAYDTTHMSSATRSAWKAVRGIPAGTDWYGCSGCTDFATPAGDFAEVYAQWARGTATNRSELAGDVPAGQLTQLAQQFFGV